MQSEFKVMLDEINALEVALNASDAKPLLSYSVNDLKRQPLLLLLSDSRRQFHGRCVSMAKVIMERSKQSSANSFFSSLSRPYSNQDVMLDTRLLTETVRLVKEAINDPAVMQSDAWKRDMSRHELQIKQRSEANQADVNWWNILIISAGLALFTLSVATMIMASGILLLVPSISELFVLAGIGMLESLVMIGAGGLGEFVDHMSRDFNVHREVAGLQAETRRLSLSGG